MCDVIWFAVFKSVARHFKLDFNMMSGKPVRCNSKVFLFYLLLLFLMVFLLYRHFKKKSFIFEITTLEKSKLKMCARPKIVISHGDQPRYVRIYTEVQYDLDPKTILLWTTIPSCNATPCYYFFLDGKTTFKKHLCPYSDCIVTSNRSYQKSADAIIFHQKTFNPLDLPKSRLINQKWIFYHLESPVTFKVPWYTRNNMFNWTMSYRSDSDVQAKYGEVCQLPPEEWEDKREDYLQNKSGEVLWFVSHCSTANNRIDYVEQLSKYIRVDIYGKCGTLKCEPTQSAKCYEDILKRYKFYLSFENSNCKDYVTEKLFNVLNYDILPVVMGSADYEPITPPNSVISAMDFPNPADLAQFLKTVGSNRTLYNSYFKWKGKYKSYLHPWMCDLCKKLHLSAGERTERNDIYKW